MAVMTRRRNRIVFAGCALALAACGGGSPDDDPVGGAPDPTDVSNDDVAGDDAATDGDAGSDEPAADDGSDDGTASGADAPDDGSTSGDDLDGGDAAMADLTGPTLEPAVTLSYGPSSSPVVDQLAVSPSGDRVAVAWVDASSGAAKLTVFDTAAGDVVVDAEVRGRGFLYWSADDRIVYVDETGVVDLLDPATAMPVGDPVTFPPFECNGGNNRIFDRDDGAFYGEFKSNGEDFLCRLDITTGELATFTDPDGVSGLAVAVDGDTAYADSIDDDRNVTLLTLDAATLTVREETPSMALTPVLAATSASVVRAQEDGFEYAVEPVGAIVPRFALITPSYSGAHYAAQWDGATLLMDAATAEVVGRIGTGATFNQYDWSSDDTVFAVFTGDGEVGVYRLG